MTLKPFVPAFVALALGAAAALTPTASGLAADRPLVKIDGSSTVYPITEAVAEEFQKAQRGAVMVTVGISGSGGGFKKFCRGEIDLANASRPILAKEMATCKLAGVKYIELPVAFDALTVVVHPQNDWVQTLTVAELKKIWEPAAQARITRWNQVNPKWPDAKLSLYGPGADSGTFDYFTDAVVGKEKASRGDYTASEDDNVLVQGVSRDKYALGYFGYAYYIENKDKLKAVPIVNPRTGTPVLPSPETVSDGSYQPLSRPLFIYVNAQSLERPEVKAFLEFYLTRAASLVKEVGYVPLSEAHYRLALNKVRAKRLGTAFGGHPEVGVRIEELLAREGKL